MNVSENTGQTMIMDIKSACRKDRRQSLITASESTESIQGKEGFLWSLNELMEGNYTECWRGIYV